MLDTSQTERQTEAATKIQNAQKSSLAIVGLREGSLSFSGGLCSIPVSPRACLHLAGKRGR